MNTVFFWYMSSSNKEERAVHGCHCPGDMVVRMHSTGLCDMTVAPYFMVKQLKRTDSN